MNDNFRRWNGNFGWWNARHRWQNAVPAEFNHWGHDVLPSLSSTFIFGGDVSPAEFTPLQTPPPFMAYH